MEGRKYKIIEKNNRLNRFVPMLIPDTTNTIFTLAASFVNNTLKHIFLTGKAGTGKTTFLKYIRENTRKKAVVVAPTGVAAINAGGVTIHSFFQLPFGPFIPDNPDRFTLFQENDTANHAFNLVKRIRFSSKKKDLMRNMELLIIDEISMVRPDMLDAMDMILRFVRKNSFQPFGGVQVLYIGDLFQLPPVVQEDEWEILRPHYSGQFFFHAKVITQAPPLYIELKKIYRQKDPLFIDLLNRVRNNTVTPEDLQLLNGRCRPAFQPPEEDPYIVLSTHNRKAEVINSSELEKLPGPPHKFMAEISGAFSERDMPTEPVLYLKEGAQVLFIKNDPEKRYYNGKIGRVTRIVGADIFICFEDEKAEFALGKEKWKNIRYSFNAEKNRIEEEELGVFTQYPLRLAWAITIHKSQGLTFSRAIIDAGASFAAGQVYVALSRCTSLDGIVLKSLIRRHCIKTDEGVIEFARREAAENELQEQLMGEQALYEKSDILQQYDFTALVEMLEKYVAKEEMATTGKRKQTSGKHSDPPAGLEKDDRILLKMVEAATGLQEVCSKFRLQLTKLLKESGETGSGDQLAMRLAKADAYFTTCLDDQFIQPLQDYMNALKGKPDAGKQLKSLGKLLAFIRNKAFPRQQVKPLEK